MSGSASARSQELKANGRMEARMQERSTDALLPDAYTDLLSLQQSAGNQAVHGLVEGGIPPVVQSVINSDGQPLEAGLRAQMESRFGQDFSGVRVHTDSSAAESAAALSAKAYTVGRSVVFGQGRYAPDTGEGKRLLAHELAHVVQQTAGGAQMALQARQSTEAEASEVAGRVVDGNSQVTVSESGGVGIAKAEDDEVPWWKAQLNPLYQRALEKLPEPAARRLRELNDGAKWFIEEHGLKDAEIDVAVQAAQPLLNSARKVLGLPPEKDIQAREESSAAIWLGTPPLEVRLKKREEQRKRDEDAQRGNPWGLGVPEPRPSAAGKQDLPPGDMFAPEPDPTPFEQQIQSGQTFKHTFTSVKQEVDPSQVEGQDTSRPSAAHPTPILELSISRQDLMSYRDYKSGELKGYRLSRGDTNYEWDREGKLTSLYGTERPLEEPAVDPIDVIMFGAEGGALAAKGVAKGWKMVVRKISKGIVRETSEFVTEEGSRVTAKKSFKQIGSEAIEAANFEAQAVKDAPLIRYEGGELPLIIEDPVPTNVVARKPRGFDTGRAGPGRNVKPGTLEDLEPTTHKRTPRPRKKGPTRAEQLEGLNLGHQPLADIAREEFDRKLKAEWADRLGLGKGDVLHHAKELHLLDRYPNVFTQDELNGLRNMRPIPKHLNAKLHLEEIRKIWNETYEYLDNVIAQRGLRPGTTEYNDFVRSVVDSIAFRIDNHLPSTIDEFGAY